MSKEISISEVKKHNNKKNLWIIIHNDVYDVSSFADEHPGGVDSLLEFAGTDGTEAFEEVGHSKDARNILKKLKIGTLPMNERNKTILSCCKLKSKWKKTKSRSECSTCSTASCPRLPSVEPTEKTWRTYDGSSSSRPSPRSEYKVPSTPRAERRVQAIVVPRESSKLKWAIVALAGAIVIGIVLKKYVAA